MIVISINVYNIIEMVAYLLSSVIPIDLAISFLAIVTKAEK
jgi:hypothetical protein